MWLCVRKQQSLPHGLDSIMPRVNRRPVVDVGGNAGARAPNLLGGARRERATTASAVALQRAQQ